MVTHLSFLSLGSVEHPNSLLLQISVFSDPLVSDTDFLTQSLYLLFCYLKLLCARIRKPIDPLLRAHEKGTHEVLMDCARYIHFNRLAIYAANALKGGLKIRYEVMLTLWAVLLDKEDQSTCHRVGDHCFIALVHQVLLGHPC